MVKFIDHGDGTISDIQTGLMWQKDGSAADKLNWRDAFQYCKKLNLGGYSDWRMPTLNELKTLINEQEENQHIMLNSQGFQNIRPENYWSATSSMVTFDGQNCSAYLLSLDGNIEQSEMSSFEFFNKQHKYHVLAVRLSKKFRDNNNGTITDIQTGLMWQKDAGISGKMNWEEAEQYCKNLTLAGYSDWRMPTMDELDTLVKDVHKEQHEWLNSQGFNNMAADIYWSASPFHYVQFMETCIDIQHFQKYILDKITSEDDRKAILDVYQLSRENYYRKNDITEDDKERIWKILRNIQFYIEVFNFSKGVEYPNKRVIAKFVTGFVLPVRR